MNTIKYNCERLLQTILSPQEHSEEREKGLEVGSSRFSMFFYVKLNNGYPSYLPLYCNIYRTIPKISPEAYIFQRPFFEGLIFWGAYIQRGWRAICISKSIGLAYRFFFVTFYFVFEGDFPGAISKYKPLGAYIWRGDLTEGFLRYKFGGLIFGGAYFRNFTVFPQSCF